MRKISAALNAVVFGASLAFVGLAGATALAQQAGPDTAPPAAPPAADAAPYIDSHCGTWQDDNWVPNGNCPPDTDKLRHEHIAGTIVFVTGHLVTLQLTDRKLVVNDQPALDSNRTGKVAVGRQVVAHGYWLDGTFFATSLV